MNLPIGAEDDNTNVVSFQVESHTFGSRLELHHLTGLDLGETEDSGDTITNGDDRSELLQVVLQGIEKEGKHPKYRGNRKGKIHANVSPSSSPKAERLAGYLK